MNSNGPVARKTSGRGAFQRVVVQAFGLRPECRAVFLLCGIQGCTINEAAAMLGIAPGYGDKPARFGLPPDEGTTAGSPTRPNLVPGMP